MPIKIYALAQSWQFFGAPAVRPVSNSPSEVAYFAQPKPHFSVGDQDNVPYLLAFFSEKKIIINR